MPLCPVEEDVVQLVEVLVVAVHDQQVAVSPKRFWPPGSPPSTQ